MENLDKLAEYAPIIVILLLYIRQNNIFIKPEQLEKKHREIVKEIEKDFSGKYVEINAYKEFQNHIYSELEKVNTGINSLTASVNDVKGVLMKRRKED